jgi:hypothetical protein
MSSPASLDVPPGAPGPALPATRRRSRTGLWLGAFLLLAALALWAGVALTQQLWADSALGSLTAPGWSQDVEVVVNGEPWSLGDALGQVLGWSVAALVMGGLLLLALALVPMTLGLVAMLVLLPVGLVLALLALPLLLVLGLLLSPLLLLGGLAWMLLG